MREGFISFGNRGHIMIRVLLLAIGIALFPVGALSDDILRAEVGSWHIDPEGSVTLKETTFEIYHEVEDMHFRGQISVAPVLRYRTSSQPAHLDVELDVRGKVLDETELGNRSWLGYRLARQHLDYPEQHVAKVTAVFDAGEGIRNSPNSFTIPKGATRLERLEVVWHGDANLPLIKTIQWGGDGHELAKNCEDISREIDRLQETLERVERPNAIAAITDKSLTSKPVAPDPDTVRLFLDELWNDFASGKARDRLPIFFSNIPAGFSEAETYFVEPIKSAVSGWRNMSQDQLASLPAAISIAFSQFKQGAYEWAEMARHDPDKFAAMTEKGTGGAMFQAVLSEIGSEIKVNAQESLLGETGSGLVPETAEGTMAAAAKKVAAETEDKLKSEATNIREAARQAKCVASDDLTPELSNKLEALRKRLNIKKMSSKGKVVGRTVGVAESPDIPELAGKTFEGQSGGVYKKLGKEWPWEDSRLKVPNKILARHAETDIANKLDEALSKVGKPPKDMHGHIQIHIEQKICSNCGTATSILSQLSEDWPNIVFTVTNDENPLEVLEISGGVVAKN